MNDLETRVRDEFHSEPAWRSPDNLLDDVRRGVRRRRARRTTGLVATAGAAVVVLVLASTGGGIGGHFRQLIAALPGHSGPDAGTSAISITGSGQLFKVTSDQGCASPCSTIWKRTDAGWTELSTFHARTATYTHVIDHISMAPNGRDGWAWGKAFYSTHDAGVTWTRITTVPYTQEHGLDVQVGPTEAWATTGSGGSADSAQDHPYKLWHTALGSDDWTRVTPPMVPAPPSTTRVEATEWNIVDVLPDGRTALSAGYARKGNPVYVGGRSGWREEKVPCRRSATLFGGALPAQEICGPVGRYLNWGNYPEPSYSRFQVGLRRLSASAPVGQPDMLFALFDQAAIDTPSGVVPSDLKLGGDEVLDWSQSGDHVAIVTSGHRVLVSDDSGRHWHQE